MTDERFLRYTIVVISVGLLFNMWDIKLQRERLQAHEGHLSAYDKHIEALEKRLSNMENGSKAATSNDQVEPDKTKLKTGDIIHYNANPASIDELGRDMTVVSSLKNQPLDPCFFARWNETITVLEVRGEYALVQYELPNFERMVDADMARGTSSRVTYCANGDVGILMVDRLQEHAVLSGIYSENRREQGKEVARVREAFSDLLPAGQAEGI